MKSDLAARLLDWYRRNRRDLPWRQTVDPYSIWVAEIMLQQTRVDTVIPYYERWLHEFPSVAALAAADQQEVLTQWEGLGYYSRARNLHKAARLMVERHDGQVPDDLKELLALPGLGKASSADILSIAFGQDIAAVDGNIRRVIARLFNIQTEQGTPVFETAVQQIVDEHLPPGEAGDYNQAWMDLGATVCLPTRPACADCPLAIFCQARQLGKQAERPVKKARAVVPTYIVTAGILRRAEQVLIARRPQDGLLGGLWEFPGGKIQDGETLPDCLRRELQEELGIEVGVGEQLGVYRHAYTHFKVVLHAFLIDEFSSEPRPLQASGLAWVSVADLATYPMGKIDRMISRDLG